MTFGYWCHHCNDDGRHCDHCQRPDAEPRCRLPPPPDPHQDLVRELLGTSTAIAPAALRPMMARAQAQLQATPAAAYGSSPLWPEAHRAAVAGQLAGLAAVLPPQHRLICSEEVQPHLERLLERMYGASQPASVEMVPAKVPELYAQLQDFLHGPAGRWPR